MAKQNEDTLDLSKVFDEQDVFKLAILGHSAVEKRIDAAIAEAFAGHTPAELKSLPFRTRLALFSALTRMQKKYATGITALAKLRNELGPIQELREDGVGAFYEVPLVDAPYVRELVLPGIQIGGYGASFRFKVMRHQLRNRPARSQENPGGLPETTVTEARVRGVRAGDVRRLQGRHRQRSRGEQPRRR
jgi:hypothetical protein